MEYNFYVLVVILTLTGAFTTFLKKDILSNCSIIEEMLFSTFFILFISVFIYIYQKNTFGGFYSKLQINKNNLLYKLLLFDILVVMSIIIGGIILKNEHIIKSGPYRTGLYLIFITLFTYLFAKKQLTFYKIIGIFTIIGGVFLLEY